MSKIHKLKEKKGGFVFTECGIPLHIEGGMVHKSWGFVDCKRCRQKMEVEE